MAALDSNWARLRAQLSKHPAPAVGTRRRSVKAADSRKPGAKATEVSEVKKNLKNKKRTAKKATKAAPTSLVSAIRLELGRWEALDRIVEAYDNSVSPVLGGAESGRAEQKRKRHLEAWLWARLFHPLLPLGEASAGDAALAQKLTNAGLAPKEAKRRVRRLADLLHTAVSPVAGDVTVVLEKSNDRVRLICGGRAVELLPAYWAKLQRLYVGGGDFNSATFLLLARYRILQVHDKGGGNQGAVPEAVFQALKSWAAPAPVLEAFASPLNTLAVQNSYHSAFPDVDAAFGSRGSFFNATFDEGVVEVNPPFDDDLIRRVAALCDKSLGRAAAAGKVLVFVVIVPETDWPGHAALKASKFARWTRTLPVGEHFYQVGNQHLNATRSYPASRNTTLLLLASRPVAGAARLGQRLEAAFRARPG